MKSKGLIVLDARSILAACGQRSFKIDYVALVQGICRCMQMEAIDVKTILIMNMKQEREQDIEEYDYGFTSAMHYYFEDAGMSLEIVTGKMYETDVAIASYMLVYVLVYQVTHLVLVSGSSTFASTFALINKHRREVYKIVCMWPRFLAQELRRQADAVYELGKDIFSDEINLTLNRKKANDKDVEDRQMNLMSLIGLPLAKTG